MKKQKKQFFGMLLVLAVLAAAYGLSLIHI